jgi:hypothetical protein
MGTPSHHPFEVGIFHETIQRAFGVPPLMENPQNGHRKKETARAVQSRSNSPVEYENSDGDQAARAGPKVREVMGVALKLSSKVRSFCISM